jgi:hypothetical protein
VAAALLLLLLLLLTADSFSAGEDAAVMHEHDGAQNKRCVVSLRRET